MEESLINIIYLWHSVAIVEENILTELQRTRILKILNAIFLLLKY